MDALLSTDAVAELLSVAPSTVRTWRSEGTGPRYARIGRKIMYHPDDVKRWWDTQVKITTKAGR